MKGTARVYKGAHRPQRDPTQRDKLALLDADFVALQQANLDTKAVPLRRNKKPRKPVSKEELDESMEKLDALLRSA